MRSLVALLVAFLLLACFAPAQIRTVALPGKSPLVTFRIVFTTGSASDPVEIIGSLQSPNRSGKVSWESAGGWGDEAPSGVEMKMLVPALPVVPGRFVADESKAMKLCSSEM